VNEPNPPSAQPAASAPPAAPAPATPAPAKAAPSASVPAKAAPAPAAPIVLVPAERTNIFPKEQAKAFIQAVCFIAPTGITDYWTPAPKDLEGVETGLEAFLKSKGRADHHNWPQTYRQVIGVIEGKNQFLLLSYFTIDLTPDEERVTAGDPHFDPSRWKREPFWVNDGGDTYFRVLYDLAAKQFVWYEKNGDA